MTAYQLDELHLTLAQMEVSDRARLAQAAGVNLSTVQKFAMSREHGVPSRTIEPLSRWRSSGRRAPARPHDPAPQRHALGHGRPARGLVEKPLRR